MDTSYWKVSTLFKLPKPTLLAGALLALALVALACAPAEEPTATSAPAAVVEEEEAMEEETAVIAEEEEAMEEETAAIAEVEAAPTGGKYIERAGLRIFLPEGYTYGAPSIPADPRSPRYGGTGIKHAVGDPPSLDPFHTTSSEMMKASGLIYDRLIHTPVGPEVDPFAHILVPGLAESWEVSDDFLTYTFHLRKGVKFQNVPPVNGRELDAEDVKASFDLFTHPESVMQGFFGAVDRVEVVDKYTAAYHMKRAFTGMVDVFATTGRGFIVPREMADPASDARRRSGIGTGPFMVDGLYEFKVGVTMRRNPDYWVSDDRGNQLPFLDRYKLAIISDASAATTAFRTGKIDDGPGVNPEQLASLARTNPNILVQEMNSNPYAVWAYGFRLDKEPWTDVRVRRALSMAIDYETMSRTVYDIPFSGVNYVPGVWIGEDESVETMTQTCGCPWYQYDPEGAKALLAEAGYPDGLNVTYEYDDFGYVDIAEETELVGSYWAEIGANVALQDLDYSVFRAGVEAGSWADLGMNFNFPYASSMTEVVQVFVPGHTANPTTGRVDDPELSALVEEFLAAWKDEARSKEVYGEIRAYWLDQVFTIPRGEGREYRYFAPRLRNYQPRGDLLAAEVARMWVTAWIDDTWDFAR